MDVAFVRRELVEVAEIDRFNGRRIKAEYVEPDSGRNVYHILHEHCLGLPIDTGVVGSVSMGCSCFGVGTYDRSEMGDSCLTGAAAGLVPAREVLDLLTCRE